MSEPRFVHLRVHSDYSMIDGLAKTAPLVKKAAALGMPALAITDFTNLCGLVKFYGAGHGAGIKPIVGADFNVQCDLLGDELTHLTVLAANNTGYQNLTLLISKAYQRGYGAAGPIIDRDWLIELNEGLILLSGGRMGDVGRSLLRGNSALVDECVAFYEEHFPDRYFLELIRTGRPDEESYLHAAVELAEARGLPVVATNDVRFIDSSDFDAHEIRVAIHDGFTLDDPKRPRNYSPQQYMRSEEEMCELFADIPEALANTVEIAKRCNVTVRLGEYFLPQFPTGDMRPRIGVGDILVLALGATQLLGQFAKDLLLIVVVEGVDIDSGHGRRLHHPSQQQQQGSNQYSHQDSPHFMASKMGLRVDAQFSGLISPTWRYRMIPLLSIKKVSGAPYTPRSSPSMPSGS